jgi:hypothetical protein
MSITHAVMTDEDPLSAKVPRDRSPWREIATSQFKLYREMRDSSTACAAAESAIIQGVLGAHMIVKGKGWDERKLRVARGAAAAPSIVEHLHMFGLVDVIIAVNAVSRTHARCGGPEDALAHLALGHARRAQPLRAQAEHPHRHV